MTSDELAERLKKYEHKCEHDVPRARAQFHMYAGPTYYCTCCRSHYGSLKRQAEPPMCPGCSA